MPTTVNWNGTSYDVPNAGELNWSDLSDFLVALGNNAQTVNTQEWSTREDNNASVTVGATDCAVICTLAATPRSVALPAGTDGRVVVIKDGAGDAASNNITVNRDGTDTIDGGTSDVVNDNYGASAYVFENGNWNVIARMSGDTFSNPMTTEGDVILGGSSPAGAPTRLGVGSTGQALISNGTTLAYGTDFGAQNLQTSGTLTTGVMTQQTDTATNPVLYFNSDNVGITDNQHYILVSRTLGDMQLVTGNSVGMSIDGSTQDVDFQSNNVTTTGNVGIGQAADGTIRLRIRDDNATAYSSSAIPNLIVDGFNTNASGTISYGALVRDVSALAHQGALTFFSPANARTAAAIQLDQAGTIKEIARFDSNGNVGIGTTGPSHKIHVDAGTNTPARFDGGNATNYTLLLDNGVSDGNEKMVFMRDSTLTAIGSIANSSGTMGFNDLSDARLKENVEEMEEGLAEVLEMRPVKFKWKRNNHKGQGLIAQELNGVYPHAVYEGSEDAKNDPWMVDYGKLTPVLIKAIQELKAEIEELKAK